MKIDPITLILNNKIIIDKFFYLISGNEITLMEKMKDMILCCIDKKKYSVERIKNVKSIKREGSLFNTGRLYVVEELGGLDKQALDLLSQSNDIYLFMSQNNPKIKSLKNIMLKRADSAVIDCYELTKETKSKILKSFLNKLELVFDNDLYWSLIDRLENRYMLMENELNKLRGLSAESINHDSIDRIISKNEAVERIFFQIFNENKLIIENYNKKITNSNEVNSLYYTIKQFSYLIISCEDRLDFENSIPTYLFREKKMLLDLFTGFNLNKKKYLLNLIFRTEKAIRKNGNLTVVLGLRLLLSFKKIAIS